MPGLPLAFAFPLVLAALAGLPLLYFLLRITPPRPALVPFPPLRLILGLRPRNETASRTPWWLLLLRLTIAASVIFAMAGPVLNPLPARTDYFIGDRRNWRSSVPTYSRVRYSQVYPGVDVVYYGTSAGSKEDSSAVWNVYLAQTTDNGASFTQSTASNSPNHNGVICTNGTGCAPGTRVRAGQNSS